MAKIARVSRLIHYRAETKKISRIIKRRIYIYADNKEGEPNGYNIKKQTPLPRYTKKRPLSTAGRKSQVKRRIERGRFSLRLSSDEETETGNKSDSSTYIPSIPRPITIPRPILSYLSGLAGNISDNSIAGFVGGRSRTAVIYEQQG